MTEKKLMSLVLVCCLHMDGIIGANDAVKFAYFPREMEQTWSFPNIVKERVHFAPLDDDYIGEGDEDLEDLSKNLLEDDASMESRNLETDRKSIERTDTPELNRKEHHSVNGVKNSNLGTRSEEENLNEMQDVGLTGNLAPSSDGTNLKETEDFQIADNLETISNQRPLKGREHAEFTEYLPSNSDETRLNDVNDIQSTNNLASSLHENLFTNLETDRESVERTDTPELNQKIFDNKNKYQHHSRKEMKNSNLGSSSDEENLNEKQDVEFTENLVPSSDETGTNELEDAQVADYLSPISDEIRVNLIDGEIMDDLASSSHETNLKETQDFQMADNLQTNSYQSPPKGRGHAEFTEHLPSNSDETRLNDVNDIPVTNNLASNLHGKQSNKRDDVQSHVIPMDYKTVENSLKLDRYNRYSTTNGNVHSKFLQKRSASEADLTSLVDVILGRVRESIVNSGYDKISIPDIYKSFYKKIWVVDVNGHFKTEGGWVKDLSTIYRTERAKGFYEGETMRVSCGFGLSNLEIGYDKYEANFLGIECHGNIGVSFSKNSILFDFNISSVNGECKAKLNNLIVNELSGLNFEINGLEPLKWLLTNISRWIFDANQQRIKQEIESILKTAIENQLETMDCNKYLQI